MCSFRFTKEHSIYLYNTLHKQPNFLVRNFFGNVETAFPQNFHTWNLREIAAFYAVTETEEHSKNFNLTVEDFYVRVLCHKKVTCVKPLQYKQL